jgi:hypothetical protein
LCNLKLDPRGHCTVHAHMKERTQLFTICSVRVLNRKGYTRTFCILDKDCIDTERELDMIGKEERLMCKEGIFLPTSVIVSILFGLERRLDCLVSFFFIPLSLDVTIPQQPVLPLDVPVLQPPVLPLDVVFLQHPLRPLFYSSLCCPCTHLFYTADSAPTSLSFNSLYYSSRCCHWTCLHGLQHPVLSLDVSVLQQPVLPSGRVCSTEVCTVPRRVWSPAPCVVPGCVYTLAACVVCP